MNIEKLTYMQLEKIKKRVYAKMSFKKDCIETDFVPNSSGYATITIKELENKICLLHRLWFSIHHRVNLPSEVYLLHSCDNTSCINPKHLRLGGALQNTQDMIKRKGHWNTNKTHCKHGHKFDEKNTAYDNKTGKRICIKCRVKRSRKSYLKSINNKKEVEI